MKKLVSVLSAAIFLGAGCTGTFSGTSTVEETPTVESNTSNPICPTLSEACEAICAGKPAPGIPENCPSLPETTCECPEPTTDTEVEIDTGKGVEADSSATIAAKTTIDAEAVIEPEVMTELTVSMDSGNFYFKPTTIEAKPGQTVHVKITSNEGFHTFVLDEVGVKKTVKPGETITFTAPTTAGSYTFYCDVGSHQAMGMKGTLIVK